MVAERTEYVVYENQIFVHTRTARRKDVLGFETIFLTKEVCM